MPVDRGGSETSLSRNVDEVRVERTAGCGWSCLRLYAAGSDTLGQRVPRCSTCDERKQKCATGNPHSRSGKMHGRRMNLLGDRLVGKFVHLVIQLEAAGRMRLTHEYDNHFFLWINGEGGIEEAAPTKFTRTA